MCARVCVVRLCIALFILFLLLLSAFIANKRVHYYVSRTLYVAIGPLYRDKTFTQRNTV